MRRILNFLIPLLFCVPVGAETLGQATQEVRDRCEAMIAQRLPQVDSWGQQTALDDLRGVHQSAAALLEAMSGNDARAVKEFQLGLSSAARRLRASQSLLPEAAAGAPDIAELETRVAAIDERLTELRLRFGEKASLTPGPLAEQSLAPEHSAFQLYENPQALLIDVRDARNLASQLDFAHFPGYGFGFMQPNNLDPLQVRRLVLAGWALERSLEGQFSDISEALDEWVKFRREYDRLGYPGSNQVVRQLDRVMERLTQFFTAVETE
jgi:hypothetical protein